MSAGGGRVLGLGQLLLGAVTLLRPAATVQGVTRGHGACPDLRIVRVLGARQVAQGALTLVRTELVGPGAAVDALHAASLVPVIAFSSRYRRAALASTALAAVAALAGRRAAVSD